MLNNNVRRLRDESGLNFVLCFFRGHIGRNSSLIQAAINGRIHARLGAKWSLKNLSFSCSADCINLGSTWKYFRKSSPQFVAN